MAPVLSGFTRKQALALTTATSNRLAYWERVNAISPKRTASTHATRPQVVFSPRQIVDLKILELLRHDLSIDKAQQVLDAIHDEDCLQWQFFFVNNELHDAIDMDMACLKVTEILRDTQSPCTIQMVASLAGVLDEIAEQAAQLQGLDFTVSDWSRSQWPQ